MEKILTGNILSENDFYGADCYIRPNLGLIIPISDSFECNNLKISAYSVIIIFENTDSGHYKAYISSPATALSEKIIGDNSYLIIIEKEYFEKRYAMYSDSLPVFVSQKFGMCSDVLKALNTFAFEYSKQMMNSDITLDAQTEIIVHWLIRSVLGETLDMRAISSDYSVAKAQHYMERHFMENITVKKLAELGYASPSTLNRRFKSETGMTPMEYLSNIRTARAKLLLRRYNIPITEVGERCGFGSSAYFSTVFKKTTGISPTEYREKYYDS